MNLDSETYIAVCSSPTLLIMVKSLPTVFAGLAGGLSDVKKLDACGVDEQRGEGWMARSREG